MFRNQRYATLVTVAVAVVMLCLTAGSTKAANVLFVDNETPDGSWRTLIESGGHSYTLFDTSSFNLSLNNTASRNYLNSFDVAVVSGSNTLFNVVRNNGQTWHSQPTPILTLAPYFASGLFTNGSWRWSTAATGNNVPGGFANSLNVGDPTDLIWTGISLNGSGPFTTPDLYDGGGRYAQLGNVGNSLKPGVTALATNPGNATQHAIMHADPGAIAPGGAASYFVSGIPGNNGFAEPFNAAGEKVFLKRHWRVGGRDRSVHLDRQCRRRLER